MSGLLDNPLITSMLFYPRAAQAGQYPPLDKTLQAAIADGTIAMTDDIALGYRLYLHRQEDAPLILFFHGNGEIAADYDSIAPLYHRVGASLLVVDYRGYGWSTGQPSLTGLLPDAEAICQAVPGLLEVYGRADVPLFVKGRSLGSASAIHLARTFPKRFRGLIVESGFADAPSLFMRLGISLATLVGVGIPIAANVQKMADIHLPVLVIHGEGDTLLPLENGRKLYAASPSINKTFLSIPGGGHNNLMAVGRAAYFDSVGRFLHDHV